MSGIVFGVNYSFRRIVTIQAAAWDVQTSINQLTAALIECDWTQVSTISGSGGTTGYELISSPTPNRNTRMRVSIWWNGTTTVVFGWPIIQIKVADSNGANSFTRDFLTIRSDLGAKSVRFVCNPFQFFCWYDSTLSPGGASYNTDTFNRSTAFGGVPVLVTPLSGGEAFWFQSGGRDFRQDVVPDSNAQYAFLINGNFKSGTNSVATTLAPELLIMRGDRLVNDVPFPSGNYPVTTPIMMIGDHTNGVVAISLWDAITVSYPYTTRVVTTADFCTWENITQNASIGTLFVVTDSQFQLTQPGYSY